MGPDVRPDPGSDLMDARLRAAGPDTWARTSMELRARGFALAWDQLDRAGIEEPVARALFLNVRLYPEMPAAHRAQVAAGFAAARDVGTWHGPVRPSVPAATTDAG